MPNQPTNNASSPHPKADNARNTIDAATFARSADIHHLNSAARGVAFIPPSSQHPGRSSKIQRIVAGHIHITR